MDGHRTAEPRREETGGPRREDPPLVTGAARFTGDVGPPGTVHAAFLRCPYGHARVERVDVGPARAHDGVVAAFGAEELAAAGGPTAVRASNYFPGPDVVERPLLVGERARFAGDPVAVVLAEDRYAANDALAAVDVDYERLPAVTDPRRAASTAEATEPIGGETADTVEWAVGDEAAVERAVERADTVVSIELSNQRLVSAPMETRAVLAEYGETAPGADEPRPGDATTGPGAGERLTVTTSTQTPHRDRDRIAETLGLPASRVRVVVPAVGGGFGPKGSRPYPEEPLVAWCATHLGRPVRWVATRSEGHRTDHHGRDVHVRARLALSDDGAIQALGVDGVVGVGGYPLRGPSSGVKPQLLTGAYEIPAVHCRLTGALTNATPLGPYRGAGRPEAIYVVERLVDRAAAALGVDPADLRRRNLVPADAFPYETPLGHTYDSGDYAAALEEALDLVDYRGWRERQADLREAGRHVGVGLGCFVENTGASRGERGRVEVYADGTVRAYCGTADGGQGHATTYSRLVADALGVPAEDVDVVEGDTDELTEGTGTFASRSAAVGGSALLECAREVVERARPVAAEHLETSPGDLRFSGGAFHVSGAPERSASLATVAALASGAESGSSGATPGDDPGPALAAERDHEVGGRTYAFGTHAAVVEVDPDSGELEVLRYVAVDDCGVRLEPTLVEGQVHGSVAQGLGQARWEGAVYDESGSLLTGSFQDYAMPRAHAMPEVETGSTVTPSPLTVHGAKGVGEAGTIAAPPAVVNAVVDALSPFGVEHVDMPLTPETVWRAVQEAEDGE